MDGHVKTQIRNLCNCRKCQNRLNFLVGAEGRHDADGIHHLMGEGWKMEFPCHHHHCIVSRR